MKNKFSLLCLISKFNVFLKGLVSLKNLQNGLIVLYCALHNNLFYTQ